MWPPAQVIFMTAVAGLSYAIILGDSFAGIAKLAGATGGAQLRAYDA